MSRIKRKTIRRKQRQLCYRSLFIEALEDRRLLTIGFSFEGRLNAVGLDNYEMVLRASSGSGELTVAGTDYDIIRNTDTISLGDLFIQIYNADDLKINGVKV